jgi:hypothetical protein
MFTCILLCAFVDLTAGEICRSALFERKKEWKEEWEMAFMSGTAVSPVRPFALHDSASHTSTGNVAASHMPHHMWVVAASLRHK